LEIPKSALALKRHKWAAAFVYDNDSAVFAHPAFKALRALVALMSIARLLPSLVRGKI